MDMTLKITTMTDKLYTVHVEYDYVVVADSDISAYAVAREYARDALSDLSTHDLDLDVTPGVTATGWDGECIPYGGDGNKRTRKTK